MTKDGFCWENSLRKCQSESAQKLGKNRENSADFCPGKSEKSGENPLKIRGFLKSEKSRTLFSE